MTDKFYNEANTGRPQFKHMDNFVLVEGCCGTASDSHLRITLAHILIKSDNINLDQVEKEQGSIERSTLWLKYYNKGHHIIKQLESENFVIGYRQK